MCNYLPQKPISSKIRDVKLSNEAASPEMAKLVRAVRTRTGFATVAQHSCRSRAASRASAQRERRRLTVKAPQVDLSRRFGKLIQLRTPGFLSNLRQHRMCGLAIIHMAQQAAAHWSADSKADGGKGALRGSRCTQIYT